MIPFNPLATITHESAIARFLCNINQKERIDKEFLLLFRAGLGLARPLKRKCFLQLRFPKLQRTDITYLNLNNFF